MKAIFFLTAMLMLTPLARGGGTVVGNGGHGVACKAGEQRIRLLDFYELEVFDQAQAKLGEPGAKPEDKAASVIQWIEEYDPERAHAYRAALSAFFSRVTWSGTSLPYVPDSHPTVLPAGCEEVQLAIQTRPDGNVHYLIDQGLWNQLSPTHQAGLILHEILYSDAIDLGHESSVNTRAFLRFLIKSVDDMKGGPYYRGYFDESVDQNHFNHYLTYTLADGEQLYFVGKDEIFDGRPSFYGGEWGMRSHACGYRTVTGESARFCSPVPGKKREFLAVADDEGTRIVKIYGSLVPHSGLPIYLANPADFGLPYPALDFEPPSWMVLRNDQYFEYPYAKIWCAGGVEIDFSDAGSERKRFLPEQRIVGCAASLDPAKPSAWLIQGKWRTFRAGTYFKVQDNGAGTMAAQFAKFAQPENIKAGNFFFDAIEMTGGDKHISLTLATPRDLTFRDGKCPLLPGGKFDPVLFWDGRGEGTHYIHLEAVKCQIQSAGQRFDVFEANFDDTSGAFLSGALAKATQLKVVVKAKSGKIVFRGTKLVPESKMVQPYSEPGFLLTYEED